MKGHWREIVDQVKAAGEVVVTHYNRPEVVVISIERYAKLKKDAIVADPLTALRSEFDRELAALNHSNAPQRLRKVFASPPSALSKAANSARRRKR